MLKSEFYKLSKSKTIFVAPLVALGLILITTLALRLMLGNSSGATIPEELTGFTGINLKALLFAAPSTANVRLLVILACCIFIAGDFASGTMRIQAASGESRVKIYLSKLIALSVFAVALVLLSVLLAAAVGGIFFGYGDSFTAEEFGILMRSISIYAYVAVGYVCFYSMVSTFFRTIGASIGISICVYLFLNLFVALITLWIPSFQNAFYYVLSTMENYAAWAGTFEQVDILRVVLVPLGTILISGGLGLWSFVSRDIK
jgi:ABC-2 type transport system permease protein